MKCNPDDFRENFADLDMSKEKEDEVILTLWEMMRTFAEMGQGVSSMNNIFPTIFDKKGLELSCKNNFNSHKH